MSEITKCEVCENLANNRCSGCHSVYYCCKEHQKSDWKQHKKFCKPFKVFTKNTLKKHLKATKELNTGDVVLQENPLVWGPTEDTIPVCLGCGKEINEENSRPCSKCGWPMCSDLCEKAPEHIPECRYTVLRGDKVSIKNFGITHPMYRCVMVLRIMYLKQFLPEVCKKIHLLESHEKDSKLQDFQREKAQMAKFILNFFKLNAIFTEEEILKIFGVIKVYSHEIPLSNPCRIAIYEYTTFLDHSCASNCAKSFSDKGRIIITAGTRINKGENLSICYTDPMWGTPNRRHDLYNSRLFWCSCSRCLDPTEFGTYFSALRCQDSECKGYLLPKTFIDNATNEKGSDWFCSKCPSKLSSYSVQDLLDRIGKDLSEMPKDDIRECKNFIYSYEELLHPNHYYLTNVKLALVNMIGQDENGLRDVSEEHLQLKYKLCQNVCTLIKRLAPGETRLRGLNLFELQAAVAEIGRRKTDQNIVYASLLESKKLLEECVILLKHESGTLLIGKIYKQAVSNLRELELVIELIPKL